MKSTDTISGIIDYLNQYDLRTANSDWRERPLYIDEDSVNANYAGLKMSSLFQPIVIHDKDCAYATAYEALLAVHVANSPPLHSVIEPETIFLSQPGNREITLLDRLARTLHALNFLLQDVDGALHLNVHPLHVLAVNADHGLVFEKILRQCGLEPTSITLEIPEHRIRDKHSLRAAIREWQSRGYRIAIDQFGEQHFALERVLELEPNVIKLAPVLAEHAVDCMSQRDKDKIAGLVERSSQRDITIIATGIEILAQQTWAHDIGITHLQGHFYGRAAPQCEIPLTIATKLDERSLRHLA